MVDNNDDALLFRRYRDLGEGENKVNVLEDSFQMDQEHTKGAKSKSSSNNNNHNNQKSSRRRLSREFRRKQYIAYKENEDDDEFNIRRISKRALASLKSIHNLADRASDQISSVGSARRQQILDELVRSGRLKVGEIDTRRKILRVCTGLGVLFWGFKSIFIETDRKLFYFAICVDVQKMRPNKSNTDYTLES